MIKVVGDFLYPESAVFREVGKALSFKQDVYLASHLSNLFGEKLVGEVVYNLEPLYDGCRSFTLGYEEVLRNNIVLDYSAKNVSYLSSLGIEAFHLPYGYHPYLNRPGHVHKDIDVLLVGSINPRRVEIVERLRKHFNIVWVQGVYGAALDTLIARSKVHLNIHYIEDHPLEVVRLNYLLANGCNVVSERGNEESVNLLYDPLLWFTDNLEEGVEQALSFKKAPDLIVRLQHDNSKAQEWLDEKC